MATSILLLDPAALDAPDEILLPLLRSAVASLDQTGDLPDPIRAVRELLLLDDEVRNGGFAQYFFNPSGTGAVDAWFASRDVDVRVHAVLSRALLRLGRLANHDLDLGTVVEREGVEALFPAVMAIDDVRNAARSADPDPMVAFQAFADRCGPPSDGLAGFDRLDLEYFETDVEVSIAAYVRRHADVFTTPLR